MESDRVLAKPNEIIVGEYSVILPNQIISIDGMFYDFGQTRGVKLVEYSIILLLQALHKLIELASKPGQPELIAIFLFVTQAGNFFTCFPVL